MTVLEEVASTQDLARDKAQAGTPALVIAHRQTGGRGRTGARWETAPRAIAASIALAGGPDATLPLAAGVAARRLLGSRVRLKWPNDVVVGDEKVAGILVEGHDGIVVAGLGVNLWWPDPPEGIAALYVDDPGPNVGSELVRAWAETLLALTLEPNWPRAEYVAACSTLGRDIVWEPHGRGRAIDIAADGSLMVVTSAGEVSLSSGAVHHVRMPAS